MKMLQVAWESSFQKRFLKRLIATKFYLLESLLSCQFIQVLVRVVSQERCVAS